MNKVINTNQVCATILEICVKKLFLWSFGQYLCVLHIFLRAQMYFTETGNDLQKYTGWFNLKLCTPTLSTLLYILNIFSR